MESIKTRILKKLLETDGYLSGQDLCEQLGVSRTAVWKYMKQLKEEGYEIEAVQNKGYCLKEIAGVHYLLPYGQKVADQRKGIVLNETGVFLWNELKIEMAIRIACSSFYKS